MNEYISINGEEIQRYRGMSKNTIRCSFKEKEMNFLLFDCELDLVTNFQRRKHGKRKMRSV